MTSTARVDGRDSGKTGRFERARSFVVGTFAALGFVLAVLLIGGLVADGLSFDRTSGGYEPPYTGYTGEPIDWEAGHVTNEGFFKDGYVLDLYVNCTTGMVSFEVFQQRWDWRKLSERALVVHRPAEACEQAAFSPRF